MWYASCPKCAKKVIGDQSSGHSCENCGWSGAECTYRYILPLVVVDAESTTVATAFNDQAVALLGMPANELKRLKDSDTAAYEAVFNKVQWKPLLFRLRAKMDNYNNQSRLKSAIHSGGSPEGLQPLLWTSARHPRPRRRAHALRSALSALRSPLSALRSAPLRSPLRSLRSSLRSLCSPLCTVCSLRSARSALRFAFSALRSPQTRACVSRREQRPPSPTSARATSCSRRSLSTTSTRRLPSRTRSRRRLDRDGGGLIGLAWSDGVYVATRASLGCLCKSLCLRKSLVQPRVPLYREARWRMMGEPWQSQCWLMPAAAATMDPRIMCVIVCV